MGDQKLLLLICPLPFNPIQAGGGRGYIVPPIGFCLAVLKLFTLG